MIFPNNFLRFSFYLSPKIKFHNLFFVINSFCTHKKGFFFSTTTTTKTVFPLLVNISISLGKWFFKFSSHLEIFVFSETIFCHHEKIFIFLKNNFSLHLQFLLLLFFYLSAGELFPFGKEIFCFPF